MKIEQYDSGEVRVACTRFFLLFPPDSPDCLLSFDGRDFADLRIVSGVHGVQERDASSGFSGPVVGQQDNTVVIRYFSCSTLWEAKEYVFEVCEDHFAYHIEVEGTGAIDNVAYFDGSLGKVGHASLFRYSRVYTSEVTMLDRRWKPSWEYSCIDAVSGPTSHHPCPPEENNHWLFCPPPFVYSFAFQSSPVLGVGLAPEPGALGFTRFQYWPEGNCFSLRLTYDGYTRVEGSWASPRIVFTPADDHYHAVARNAGYLYSNGLAVRPERRPAPWWHRPMFCGWGEQNMISARLGGGGAPHARQENYDHFMHLLEERKLKPGTITIDDKWQAQYATFRPDPDKWPDMRAWIDARHARGQKVLLWMGLWNPEGLPEGECIRERSTGRVVCVDPSNPAYQKRLAESVRFMVSGEGLDADGFKVDWTNGMPVGPGFTLHGPGWGMDLLKTLHRIIYEAAHACKPDALVVTHAANAHFADVTDMLRLNDISAVQRDVIRIMWHRQKLALAACPDWLIDCDNSSAPTRQEWLEYSKIQPDLGVPSLYFLTGVDGTGEPIPLEDFDVLPDIWRA